MKRMKVPDYKDKNVFGVPLIVHVQRSGQPLPLGMQQALRYLRSQCLDQVGHSTLRLHLTCIFTCDVTSDWVYLTYTTWCNVSLSDTGRKQAQWLHNGNMFKRNCCTM